MFDFLPLCVVCMHPYLFCFVFRGKKTNPRQTQPAFRHLQPWRPVIPLDRKDFRLDLMSMSRGSRRWLRAERAESTAERGVGRPRGEGPTLGPPLPALLEAGVLCHPNLTFEASRGGGSLEVTQWEEQDLNPEFLPPSAVCGSEAELGLGPRQRAMPPVAKVGQGVRAPGAGVVWGDRQLQPVKALV